MIHRKGELAAFGHVDEGDTLCERVPLVLALPEVVEALSDQIFVNLYQTNRGAVQEDFTYLDSLSMVAATVEESDDLVEDVGGGRQ